MFFTIILPFQIQSKKGLLECNKKGRLVHFTTPLFSFLCVYCVCMLVCTELEWERGQGPCRFVSELTKMTRQTHISVGVNTDISGDLPIVDGVNELNIEGALTDELKLLQVYTIEYVLT